MRATASATIAFGLVSVPVKIYVSASDEGVKFNQLTPAGNRVRQKIVDSVSGEEVAADDLTKGFEFATGQYVTFSKDELESLQVPSTKTINLQEFVDASTIDFIQVEKSYYLGPDKGGDKGYALLSDTMQTLNRVAIAQWATKGKEHLVVIRPYRSGLVLQILFYADEVRDFSQIEVRPTVISDAERELAVKLLEGMTNRGGFDPDEYEDTFAKAVRSAVDDKIAGKEITIAQDAPVVTTLDLFDALKKSVTAGKAKPKTAKKGKKR